MSGIPGSERTLSADELHTKFGAQQVKPVQDVSQDVIRVTMVLRAGADADAVRREGPTRLELCEAHRPNLRDLHAVVDFARAHDLTVVDLDRPPGMVVLQGTVSKVTTAFGTKVEAWEQPWPWPSEQSLQEPEPEHFPFRLRPNEKLQVPEDLAPIVKGVFGIDNRKEARMHMWAVPEGAWAAPMQRWRNRMHMWAEPTDEPDTMPTAPDEPSNPPHSYTVKEVAKRYDFPDNETKGREQTIAVLSLGGRLDRKGLAQDCERLGIEVPEIIEVPVDCELLQLGKQPDEDIEVALDVHILAALVPHVRIVIYYVENTSQGFINGLAQAIYNESLPASIISTSWGLYEETWTRQARSVIDDLLMDAVALNITVCCASGDLGSSDGDPAGRLHVDFPASSPHILSCGGTTLRCEAADLEEGEIVWDESEAIGSTRGQHLGSGGGQSSYFDKPDWQRRSPDPGLEKMQKRGVPDVAAFADPRNGFTISVSGKSWVVGGTSAAAPLWAGLIALINENLEEDVGYLNPDLYLKVNRAAFFDIEIGSNGSNGKWDAMKDWDACTGLGRPWGNKLLQELQSPSALNTGPGTSSNTAPVT